LGFRVIARYFRSNPENQKCLILYKHLCLKKQLTKLRSLFGIKKYFGRKILLRSSKKHIIFVVNKTYCALV
ncbi:MAG: hypothetical protein LBN27_11625, partial [Prevotellaceae bacterium]|nr:hypothetical protein [Prevotellaceae bacterium]